MLYFYFDIVLTIVLFPFSPIGTLLIKKSFFAAFFFAKQSSEIVMKKSPANKKIVIRWKHWKDLATSNWYWILVVVDDMRWGKKSCIPSNTLMNCWCNRSLFASCSMNPLKSNSFCYGKIDISNKFPLLNHPFDIVAFFSLFRCSKGMGFNEIFGIQQFFLLSIKVDWLIDWFETNMVSFCSWKKVLNCICATLDEIRQQQN